MWTRFEGDSLSESNHEAPRRFCGETDVSVSDISRLHLSSKGAGLYNVPELCLLAPMKACGEPIHEGGEPINDDGVI